MKRTGGLCGVVVDIAVVSVVCAVVLTDVGLISVVGLAGARDGAGVAAEGEPRSEEDGSILLGSAAGVVWGGGVWAPDAAVCARPRGLLGEVRNVGGLKNAVIRV